VDDLVSTGTRMVGASALDDLPQLRAACRGRLSVIGNLNGIEMRRWTAAEARSHTRRALEEAGDGGGFILSDNHGEIPWQVSDEVLEAIAETVREEGRCPPG
jgi:uroporphyrinogen decarboxylase